MNLPSCDWLKAEWDSEEGNRLLDRVRKLAVLAEEIGLPIHHLAIIWCLANPHVSTIILGASKKPQLADNLKALQSKDKLTPEVVARIEEIMENKPVAPPRY